MKWKRLAAALAAATLALTAPGCGTAPADGTQSTQAGAPTQPEGGQPSEAPTKAAAESVERTLEKAVDSSAAAAADSVIAKAELAAGDGGSVLEELRRMEAEGAVESGSIKHYPEAGVYTFVADGVPCVVKDGLGKGQAMESADSGPGPEGQGQAPGTEDGGDTGSIQAPPLEG